MLSLKRRLNIFLPVLTSVILFGITVFYLILPAFEDAIILKKKEMLREISTMAVSVLDIYSDFENSGRMSRQQAQAEALGVVRSLRYGADGKDYFWINDLEPRMIVHPYRPDLDGKNLSDFSDPDGNFLFNRAVEVVKEKGAGYISYSWQWKDDPNRVEPKISYVRLYEPWGWIVGTGVYVDDVDHEVRAMAGKLILVGVVVLAVVSALSAYIIWQGVRSERERTRIQDSLLEAYEKFRAVLEASPNPIAVFDPRGRATYINPSFTRVFGWTSEEVLGGPIDFVPESDKVKTKNYLRRLAGGELEQLSAETVRKNKDGELVDVQVSAASFLDKSGALAGVVVNFNDITELKQYSQALAESEEKFRSISSNALDGIVMIDAQGRAAFWNAAAARIFGYEAEEILGQDIHHILASPNYYKMFQESWTKFQDTGSGPVIGRVVELMAARKSGERFPVELSVSTVNLQGRRHALGIVRDVSIRKEFEHRLTESKALLDKSQEMANIGSWKWDPTTGEVVWSEETYRIHGYDPYSVEPTYELRLAAVHPEDRSRVEATFDGAMTSQTPFESEYRLIRPDGSIRYVHERGEIVRIHPADPPRFIGAVQDITLRQQAEEERSRLEDQLRQSQKLEAVGTLAGGIAHDFNNILASIVGYAEMAESRLERDSSAAVYLNEVLESADRAKKLVRQILTFSRHGEREWLPLSLGEVVEDSMKFLRSSLPSTIEIRYSSDLTEDAVWGDPTQIHQILMNLFLNAAHAMTEGGGVIRSTLEGVDIMESEKAAALGVAIGRYLKLTVRDTGHGMAPEILNRIFEPFFTTKGRGEGTGMGLAVVHGIVRDHGGAITVSSQLNQGTAFEIYLPQYFGKVTEDHPVAKVRPGGSERIIFVDDEQPITVIWTEALTGLGYKVTSTTDSKEALELFKQAPNDYDLIISDQTMPKYTGLALAQQVVKIRPGIPIILCSGFSESINKKTASEIGISVILNKPITLYEMAETVRNVLDGRA